MIEGIRIEPASNGYIVNVETEPYTETYYVALTAEDALKIVSDNLKNG